MDLDNLITVNCTLHISDKDLKRQKKIHRKENKKYIRMLANEMRKKGMSNKFVKAVVKELKIESKIILKELYK